jgi:hypothetical protein
MERSEQKKALVGVLFQPVLLVPMRIRIQGFDDQKLKKKIFTADIYSYFFIISIYLSLAHHKGRPSYRRSLQPSKENIQHYKT